jgi:hypothetical protein
VRRHGARGGGGSNIGHDGSGNGTTGSGRSGHFGFDTTYTSGVAADGRLEDCLSRVADDAWCQSGIPAGRLECASPRSEDGCLHAMTTPLEIHAVLRDVLGEAGFIRRGPAWVKRTSELIWILQPDRPPYGNRYALDIGVSLLRSTPDLWPIRANYCQIYASLESLPLPAPPEVVDTRLEGYEGDA